MTAYHRLGRRGQLAAARPHLGRLVTLEIERRRAPAHVQDQVRGFLLTVAVPIGLRPDHDQCVLVLVDEDLSQARAITAYWVRRLVVDSTAGGRA